MSWRCKAQLAATRGCEKIAGERMRAKSGQQLVTVDDGGVVQAVLQSTETDGARMSVMKLEHTNTTSRGIIEGTAHAGFSQG